jgi:hypothetical protein
MEALAPPPIHRSPRRRLAFFLLVGLVLAIGLIGKYALPTTCCPPIGYSQFLGNVADGYVTRVVQVGTTLKVETKAGASFEVEVPSVLTNVYDDMRAAAGDTTPPPNIYSAEPAPDTSWIGLLITAVLPMVLLVVAAVVVVAAIIRRDRRPPDAAARLRALDQAWREGLVSDDERAQKRAQILEQL